MFNKNNEDALKFLTKMQNKYYRIFILYKLKIFYPELYSEFIGQFVEYGSQNHILEYYDLLYEENKMSKEEKEHFINKFYYQEKFSVFFYDEIKLIPTTDEEYYEYPDFDIFLSKTYSLQ